MSQFDIAAPVRSKELAALIYAIHSHLARLLGFSALDQEFSLVSEFVKGLTDLAPIEAWERDSFLEHYCQRVDLDLIGIACRYCAYAAADFSAPSGGLARERGDDRLLCARSESIAPRTCIPDIERVLGC